MEALRKIIYSDIYGSDVGMLGEAAAADCGFEIEADEFLLFDDNGNIGRFKAYGAGAGFFCVSASSRNQIYVEIYHENFYVYGSEYIYRGRIVCCCFSYVKLIYCFSKCNIFFNSKDIKIVGVGLKHFAVLKFITGF